MAEKQFPRSVCVSAPSDTTRRSCIAATCKCPADGCNNVAPVGSSKSNGCTAKEGGGGQAPRKLCSVKRAKMTQPQYSE